MLFFLDAFFQLNLFATSAFSKLLMLLSSLSKPDSSCIDSISCPSNCVIKSPVLFAISWSSMSEGISSFTLFSFTASRGVTLLLGITKSNLQALFFLISLLWFQPILAPLQLLRVRYCLCSTVPHL